MQRDGTRATDVHGGDRTLRQVWYLITIELRRSERAVRSFTLFSAAVIAWMVVGGPGSTNAAMFGLSCAFMYATAPTMNAFRDRLEGTLWLVSMLPVAPRVPALSRLVTVAILAVPAAVMFGIVLVEVRTLLPLPVLQHLGAMVAFWAVCMVLGSWLMVTVLALTPHQLQWLPIGILGASVAVGAVLDSFIHDPASLFMAGLRHPWAVPVAVVMAAALCFVTAHASLLILSHAIARFEQPDLVRDTITRGRLK